MTSIDKLRTALSASQEALTWHTCPSGGDEGLDAKALAALTEARAALEEMEKRTLPADKKERVLRILSEFDATEEFPGKRDTEFAFECLRTLVGCEK
jgi:hypothetical protein